jgi:hypothetical protein
MDNQKGTCLCLSLELKQKDKCSEGIHTHSLNCFEDNMVAIYVATEHIWILHGLPHCINPAPTLMTFEIGVSLNPTLMLPQSSSGFDPNIRKGMEEYEHVIEFTIHPGFELNFDISQVEVYLTKKQT